MHTIALFYVVGETPSAARLALRTSPVPSPHDPADISQHDATLCTKHTNDTQSVNDVRYLTAPHRPLPPPPLASRGGESDPHGAVAGPTPTGINRHRYDTMNRDGPIFA